MPYTFLFTCIATLKATQTVLQLFKTDFPSLTKSGNSLLQKGRV